MNRVPAFFDKRTIGVRVELIQPYVSQASWPMFPVLAEEGMENG